MASIPGKAAGSAACPAAVTDGRAVVADGSIACTSEASFATGGAVGVVAGMVFAAGISGTGNDAAGPGNGV